MADLLESLETGLRSDVSARLRGLVDRIDQYILSNKSTYTRRDSPNRILPIEAFDGTFSKIERPQTPPFSPSTDMAQAMQFPIPVGQMGGPEMNLPFEMLQDWPWPLDPSDNTGLFPDILAGWSH